MKKKAKMTEASGFYMSLGPGMTSPSDPPSYATGFTVED